MAETIEDLNLPLAVVQRLIKEALPKEASKLVISKELRVAAQRTTSLFILHLTTQAMTEANKHKRKTVTEIDVLDALKEIGYGYFAEILAKDLPDTITKSRKRSSTKKNESKSETTLEETMEVDEEDETEVEEEEPGDEEEAEEEEDEEEPDK